MNTMYKVGGLILLISLMSSQLQIGEKVFSATVAIDKVYKEVSTKKGYEAADEQAAKKYGWMSPTLLAAFREKESGKNGMFLSKDGGGDPIARNRSRMTEESKACWGNDGLPANGLGTWAFSQYQIDMAAHCNWYKENPNIIQDLNSKDEKIRQAAMNKFADKSAEIINNYYKQIVNSGLFTAEETVPAIANAYNQGVGGLMVARKKGRPLGSGTTTKNGKYYHVEFMEIYNRLKAEGK